MSKVTIMDAYSEDKKVIGFHVASWGLQSNHYFYIIHQVGNSYVVQRDRFEGSSVPLLIKDNKEEAMDEAYRLALERAQVLRKRGLIRGKIRDLSYRAKQSKLETATAS